MASSQEKVYLSYLEVINMNSGFQYSSTRLLKTYMEEKNRFNVVLIQGNDSTLMPAESFDQTKARAQSYGANFFVMGELNRIGETVIVSISMYNTNDGNKIWSDKLKAQSPEDIDPIMQKIGFNIGTENNAASNGDIYSVTNYESKELRKIEATNNFGLSLGGAFPLTSLYPTTLSGIGLFWSYDARDIIMELKAQGYWAEQKNILAASIEAYYPIAPKKNTFMLGGGLGFSGVNDNSITNFSSDNNGNGLMVIVGGGYVFNRNSTVQLRASANAFAALYKVKNEKPLGAILKLELLFGTR